MIDLHCHSTASDGEYRPSQLALMAAQAGVTALALTDHDTTDGLKEFLATESPVERIPGIELSCTLSAIHKIHLVGLFINPSHAALQESLVDIRRWRDERNLRILARLKELGMPLELEEVQAIAWENQDPPRDSVIGRPHIALAMVRRHYCKNAREAFTKYLGNERPAYVQRRSLDAKQGIQLLHDAGGIVIWAHPFTSLSKRNKVAHAIKELMFYGIDGLETIYPDYKPGDQAYGHRLAQKERLLESGGSDFHGPAARNNVQLGIGNPTAPICVPEEYLDSIHKARNHGA